MWDEPDGFSGLVSFVEMALIPVLRHLNTGIPANWAGWVVMWSQSEDLLRLVDAQRSWKESQADKPG